MANGDAPAAAPDVPHFDTRFVVQAPDGSTSTQVLRTDRPLSHDELAAHAAQQGNTFVGYPDTPPAPAPAAPPAAPAEAPPGDTSAAFHPSVAQRAAGIYFPERSFKSQLPSVGGAVAGSAVAGLTGPAAPFVAPITAGIGSALGEAGDIAYEKLTGSPPAEPAGAWERIGNAGIRGASFEALAAPVAWAARPVMTALKPVGAAVRELAPVLRQDLPAGVQTVENVATGGLRSIDHLLSQTPEDLSKALAHPNLQLSDEGAQTLFRAWWQRQAGNAPEEIANAWEGLTGSAQQTLAGPQREAMQTVVNTLKTGQDLPKLAPALYGGVGGTAATAATLLGHPIPATMIAAPSLVKAAGEAVPYVASRMVQTPGGAATLAWLPRAAQVAAPLTRAGVQSAGALKWPLASTLAPGP